MRLRWLSCSFLTLNLLIACSDQVPLNIKITSQGSADDVLSVSAKTGDGKVTLSWQLPSNGKGVTIRRDTAGFPFGPTSGTEVYAGSAASFTDSNVILGQRYYYLIITIDNNLNFAGGVQKSVIAYDHGSIASNPSTGSDYSYVILVDGNALYIGGLDRTGGLFSQWRIEKRDKISGALDSGFGSGGILQVDPNPAEDDEVRAMIIDGNDLYIAGSDLSLGTNNAQWRIEKRNKLTGALDTAFDGDGIVLSNPSAQNDDVRVLAIDSTGLFIGGNDRIVAGNSTSRIEKRNKVTGALDTGFDGDGILTIAQSPSDGEEVRAIVIDGAALYLGIMDYLTSDGRWRIDKRDTTTGALDTGFDGDGILYVTPSVNLDEFTTMAVDGLSLYLAGTDRSLGSTNAQWRIEKRNKATGVLDAGFDGDGILTSNPSSNDDEKPRVLLFDATGMYIGGYDALLSFSNTQWRIEKRNKATGALLPAFDTDGILQINFSNASEEFKSMWLDGSTLYFVGLDNSPGNMQWRIEKADKDSGAKITGALFENP